MTGKASERGAALLTVLLIVAVVAVLASYSMDRLTGATRLAGNAQSLTQAKAYSVAAETFALRTAEQIIQVTDNGERNPALWNGQVRQIPVPGGLITANIRDGGNCFNLNSLVQQNQALLVQRQQGWNQFVRLMGYLELSPGEAAAIADSTTDWIDSDTAPLSNGAEDGYYQQLENPYRTSNAVMVDISELRAIKGMTPEIFARISPWLCALPEAELSPLNINSLGPDKAALLAMLGADGDLVRVRQFLARRPENGFGSLNIFWAQPVPGSLGAPTEAQAQVRLAPRWFSSQITVELPGAVVEERIIIDGGRTPAQIVSRQRGDGL